VTYAVGNHLSARAFDGGIVADGDQAPTARAQEGTNLAETKKDIVRGQKVRHRIVAGDNDVEWPSVHRGKRAQIGLQKHDSEISLLCLPASPLECCRRHI